MMRFFPLLLWVGLTPVAYAHQHVPVTHHFQKERVGTPAELSVRVVDAGTGEPLAVRLSFSGDGKPFTPEWVDEHGIHFTSIHESKKERFSTVYSKGTGPVTVGIPEGVEKVEVWAARGFEFRTSSDRTRIENGRASVSLEMSRWVNLEEAGWIAVDEHLHYDRLTPEDDPLWFSMLEADGLTTGHFMVLKGGMVPGIWARQFAHGAEGMAAKGGRSLVPGQEYRDSAQGHINLLGTKRVIEPYSTGGMGTPGVKENFPPLLHVLEEARAQGGSTGVAHGGTLGRHPTAVADAVLGAVDFWEISNGFIYDTETWYRLTNCGFFLPPAAGTDLPNSPYRDNWQPLLGSVRMYVQSGGKGDFESFKGAMDEGRVFITGGPLIKLSVNGKSMGEAVQLPEGGGRVTVRATLLSPYRLRAFQLVYNGEEVSAEVRKRNEGGIHTWAIQKELVVSESGWVAAWGKGLEIPAQGIDAMAHTNAIQIRVGDQTVRSGRDAGILIKQLSARRSHYQHSGVYADEKDRQIAVSVFDRAIDVLRKQRLN